MGIVTQLIFRDKQKKIIQKYVNPIQDEEGGKKAPYQFFPVTSTNVGISPQIILTYTFNLFAILMYNFRPYLVPVSNY